MKSVISVIGRDRVGILARVATACADLGVNIEDVSQTILSGTFAMIMLAELPDDSSLPELEKSLAAVGRDLALDVRVTRQDLYDEMHRI